MLAPIFGGCLVTLMLTPVIKVDIQSHGVKTEYQDQPTVVAVPVGDASLSQPTVVAVPVNDVSLNKTPVVAVPGEPPTYKEVVYGNSWPT